MVNLKPLKNLYTNIFFVAGFELQCRVVNKPYDIFGTWYSDQYLLSGDLHWLAHLVSASYLRLNRASQETDSEHIPITQSMYRFYNRNASSIRSIMVANCLSDPQQDDGQEQNKMEGIEEKSKVKATEHGNPVSHRNMNAANIASTSGSCKKTQGVFRKKKKNLIFDTKGVIVLQKPLDVARNVERFYVIFDRCAQINENVKLKSRSTTWQQCSFK